MADSDYSTGQTEEGSGSSMENSVTRWDAELKLYEKAAKQWSDSFDRITDRYSLEGNADQLEAEFGDTSKFNVLWSNVQTMHPALFAREPIPVVERRHKDPDPVGRLAAQTLERAVSTEMEDDNMMDVFGRVVLDNLLGGRGVPWVRYDPDISVTDTPLTIDTGEDGQKRYMDPKGNEVDDVDMTETEGGPVQRTEDVAMERAPVDYVFWKDFAHKPARTWEELMRDGWVARRVRMTRKKGVERFGEKFKDVPLTAKPEGLSDSQSERMDGIMAQADVWEIWCMATKKVKWLCRGYREGLLDEADDPLKLRQFFPCPQPAYGTLTNRSLMPIPDYLQYEALAQELDNLTDQIAVLTKALRVRGWFDSSMEGLASLLEDGGEENRMVSVPGLQHGDLTKGVQFLDIGPFAAALMQLYQARDQTKQTLFEVSGVSDILRGQVDPREKLGQSQLKGQFASQRLEQRRAAVARCAKDVINIKVEIIAENFQPETIRNLSGFDYLPEVVSVREGAEAAIADFQAQMEQAEAQMAEYQQAAETGQAVDEQGQPLPPPEVPDLGEPPPDPEMVVEDQFAAVMDLIRDDAARGFRVDIETDSTVALNESEIKEERTAFLESAGNLLDRSLGTITAMPQMGALVGELLLFGIRGFKAGRPVEAAFEEAVEQLKALAQPQEEEPPPPDPAAEAAAAKAEAEIQVMTQKAQMESQSAQQKMAAEGQKAQMDAARDQQRLEFEREKATIDLGAAQQMAQIKIQEAQSRVATTQAIAATRAQPPVDVGLQ